MDKVERARESEFVAGPVWYDPDDECWTTEIQFVGGHYVMATIHGGTQQQAEQRRDLFLAALEPLAERGREALLEAEKHLHEGLTAALPSDDQGWMVRSRFEKALEMVRAALREPSNV